MRSSKLCTMAVVLFVAVMLLPCGSTEVGAQPELDPGAAAPVVVGITAHAGINHQGSTVYRVWSDGLVEKNRTTVTTCGNEQWCGWIVVPE